MADIDLKALVPGVAPASSVIVGAANTAAASPSLYTTVGAGKVLLTNSGTTITTNTPVLDLSQTWNAGAVTFTGMKFSFTDTASSSSSLFADFQVGGVSILSINKFGSLIGKTGGVAEINILGGSSLTNGATITVSGNSMSPARAGRITFSRSGWFVNAQFDSSGNFILPSNKTMGFSPTGDTSLDLSAADVTMSRNTIGSIRVNGGTVTTSGPVFDIIQTWNNAPNTFTGLKLNITDTASSASSLLLDLQVGSVSKFNVSKAGTITTGVSTGVIIADSSGNGFGLSSGIPRAYVGGNIVTTFNIGSINIPSTSAQYYFNNDIILSRAAAATLQFGNFDAAAPVAQTLQVQNVVAGTSNTAGANLTINGSRGTGTGLGGSIILQVAPAGTTGTAQNALGAALTITSAYALQANASGSIGFSTDLILTRPAAATLQMGAADAAAPVAQTLQAQSVVAGTSNTAGANLTINGSKSTGSGVGGSIVLQGSAAGGAGTAQNALTPLLTVAPVLTGNLLSVVNNSAVTVFTVSDSGAALSNSTGGIGYGTGAGGAVTQLTSRTTGVTINKTCGAITLFSAAGSASWQTFTVTNSLVAATDTIVVNQKSGTDLYMIAVTAVAAGSFNISFATTGGTTTEQPVFNFSVVKAVVA